MSWKPIEGNENLVDSDDGIVSLSKRGYGSLQFVQPPSYGHTRGTQVLLSRFPHMLPPDTNRLHRTPPQCANNRMAAPVMDVVLTSLLPPSTLNPGPHFDSSSSSGADTVIFPHHCGTPLTNDVFADSIPGIPMDVNYAFRGAG